MINLFQVVFILGIINIISLFLVLLSCRCMLGIFVSKLYKYKWYQKLYRFHGYYWWIFVVSVLLHAVLAFIAFGSPF